MQWIWFGSLPGAGNFSPSTIVLRFWNPVTGGVDASLGRRHLGGLATADEGGDGGNGLESRRLELRLGYGFAVFRDRFSLTPEVGLGRAAGRREYAVGWRLNLSRGGASALDVSFEAKRREATGANDNVASEPERGVGLAVGARW